MNRSGDHGLGPRARPGIEEGHRQSSDDGPLGFLPQSPAHVCGPRLCVHRIPFVFCSSTVLECYFVNAMGIDDEIEKSEVAAEIVEEAERSVQAMLMRSGITGMVSLIPSVGDTINQMLTELAFKRTHDRMLRMFQEMSSRIREVNQEKINREWFRSEEFQTLLFEAIHQLHVTHDQQKINMLGAALANSGLEGFGSDDRKELFLQLIRTLTPQHIAKLNELLPVPQHYGLPRPTSPDWSEKDSEEWMWKARRSVKGKGADMLVLQMLAANALVEESLDSAPAQRLRISSTPTIREAKRALESLGKQTKKPPVRSFLLSELGRDFLRFVGSSKEHV